MTTATPGTGQGDGLKYCCLQRGHTYSENTLHVCATEEERNTLTQSLIYGESASGPDELEQWAKYAEELRETGNIEFEGDPGLEWFTAHISQPAASLPSTAEGVEAVSVTRLYDLLQWAADHIEVLRDNGDMSDAANLGVWCEIKDLLAQRPAPSVSADAASGASRGARAWAYPRRTLPCGHSIPASGGDSSPRRAAPHSR